MWYQTWPLLRVVLCRRLIPSEGPWRHAFEKQENRFHEVQVLVTLLREIEILDPMETVHTTAIVSTTTKRNHPRSIATNHNPPIASMKADTATARGVVRIERQRNCFHPPGSWQQALLVLRGEETFHPLAPTSIRERIQRERDLAREKVPEEVRKVRLVVRIVVQEQHRREGILQWGGDPKKGTPSSTLNQITISTTRITILDY